MGEGTAGAVHRARHRETGEVVALKLLHNANAENEDVQKRFVREMSILQRLEHPNVVRMIDCGLHEDLLYYAMDLVPYGTLKDVLARRGRLPWRDAAECAAQIATALDYLHGASVVHRDLKPGNVFVSDDGRLKLGDFGLARDAEAIGLTIEGFTVGTCRYMSPEQIRGTGTISGRSDLYALGCLLFEMLTGRVPYDGATMIEIFDQHLERTPPSVRDSIPDCPEALDRLVSRMLAKDPADRPASAADVLVELEGILADPERAADVSSDSNAEEPASPPSLTERLVSGPSAVEAPGASWGFIVGVIVALVLLVVVASSVRS